MASPKDNMEQLEELFRQDGRGCLLIGYETGMDKPHAAISYQLYPVNPEQDGMTYQFLGLLHVGVETARISAFVPDTRLEIYRFPRMSDVPSISRDIPVREYITDKLLPHIRRYGLEPVVSVNLRDAVFMRSALKRPMEPGGRLRLTAAEIDRLMDFRLLQDEKARLYGYDPAYKLPLHIVETSRGILVFSDGPAGQKGLEEFYQHLADNYWWIHSEPGPVKQYDMHSVPASLAPLIDASCRKDPDTGRYVYEFTDSPVRADLPDERKLEPVLFTDMTPSAEGYRNLTEFSGCGMNRCNADIYRLLSLTRHFDRQLILDPAFSYRHQFREFVERMDSFLRGNPGDDDMGKILDDMHGKAGRILKTDFDVRGHRTLERLLNDCSVPFLIGDHEADDTLRRALLEGKWIYFPGLSAKMPGLRYIHADKTCDRVMAYKNPPGLKPVYQVKDGKIVPYEAKAVKTDKSRAKRNSKRNNLKL